VFHLGWFLGASFGIQPWTSQWSGTNGRDWMKPDLYVDLATALERARFDYLFIEDTAMIEDAYKKSMETSLRWGIMAPKNDPLPLVPLLGQATSRLGIIATISTTQYPPFLAARLMTTLDHLTNGRAGINIVTSVSHRAAQNYGSDRHLDHDLRYEMAGEWVDVVTRLWESWEPDAVLHDTETPRYVDHTKVHTIDFEGKYFRSRGPLNTVPGPQRRPVIAQAGTSPPGRDLAARSADTMLAPASSVEKMKELREDMQRRLVADGRGPGDCKILFLVTPVIGETEASAQERRQAVQAYRESAIHLERALWQLSYSSGGIDFSEFDLDEPLPDDLVGSGEQSAIAHFVGKHRGKTLRQAVKDGGMADNLDFCGTPDAIAGQMAEVMEEVGGDGFLLSSEMTRRAIAEITDGLAPALQRRGVTRTEYEHELFRDNLLSF
jgi:long-chain alkane monooxygenase